MKIRFFSLLILAFPFNLLAQKNWQPQFTAKHISGFNRNYFDQPYYGFKLKFLEKLVDKSRVAGFSFSYLWTKASDSNFDTERMLSFGFVLQL